MCSVSFLSQREFLEFPSKKFSFDLIKADEYSHRLRKGVNTFAMHCMNRPNTLYFIGQIL